MRKRTKLGIFLVVVQDTILQSREYAVIAKDAADAKTKIARGLFLTESEASTMDTLRSEVLSAERVDSI